MKKISIILVSILLFVFGITYAQKTLPDDDKPLMKERMFDRIAERLELTDQQKDQLKELNTKLRDENNELRKKVRVANGEFRELMKNKNPDENVVNQKISEINALNSSLKKSGIKAELEKRKIYSDEQWEKVKKMRKFFAMRNRRAFTGRDMMNPYNRPYMLERFMPNYREFDDRPHYRKERMEPFYPGFGENGGKPEEFDFAFQSQSEDEMFTLDEELFYEDDIPLDDYIIDDFNY